MTPGSPAPICLFVYKRLDTFKNTVASLLKNRLAPLTEVHIFSDAALNASDHENVDEVRQFAAKVEGFSSVSLHLSEKNKGLAKSIIDGVTQVIAYADQVIVLEDDLVVSDNFLDFMNQALFAYRDNKKIFSISGYSSPVKTPNIGDVYFTKRSSSWGWATWKDRWEKVDWSVADFGHFITDREQQKQFNRMGSDLTHMLKKQMNQKLNSWAIRWVFHQFKYDLFTVFPMMSKVSNNGFEIHATNTSKNMETRFDTDLDKTSQVTFSFPQQACLDPVIIKQFVAPYTIATRVRYKLKELFHL